MADDIVNILNDQEAKAQSQQELINSLDSVLSEKVANSSEQTQETSDYFDEIDQLIEQDSQLKQTAHQQANSDDVSSLIEDIEQEITKNQTLFQGWNPDMSEVTIERNAEDLSDSYVNELLEAYYQERLDQKQQLDQVDTAMTEQLSLQQQTAVADFLSEELKDQQMDQAEIDAKINDLLGSETFNEYKQLESYIVDPNTFTQQALDLYNASVDDEIDEEVIDLDDDELDVSEVLVEEFNHNDEDISEDNELAKLFEAKQQQLQEPGNLQQTLEPLGKYQTQLQQRIDDLSVKINQHNQSESKNDPYIAPITRYFQQKKDKLETRQQKVQQVIDVVKKDCSESYPAEKKIQDFKSAMTDLKQTVQSQKSWLKQAFLKVKDKICELFKKDMSTSARHLEQATDQDSQAKQNQQLAEPEVNVSMTAASG